MRTKEEIEEKLRLYKEHIKVYSPSLIAHSEKEKNDYISQEEYIQTLEWVLDERRYL